jgi:hypothetical protein
MFTCEPSAIPDELPLPRLTRVQLQNTLQFALEKADPADATAIWAAIEPTFIQYMADRITPNPKDVKGGFSRVDQSIQQNQITTMYQVGAQMGQQLTTAARIGTVLGACATNSSTADDAACLQGFIQSWGSRVLRRPLTSDDVAFYSADALDSGTPVDPGVVADVINALVNAPETLYRVEHGMDAGPSSVVSLSPFELASRLSYQFLQAPPDDTLWSLATSGQLSDPAVYAQQVSRLLSSPNAQEGLDEFLTEWLRLNELPPMNTLDTKPFFEAFAGTPLPSASTRGAMIADVTGAMHAAVSAGGTASSFLRDTHSYATDSYVAGLYGVTAWDGLSAPPTPASALRAGLITRPAMLATGTATTDPIHKGYQVRNAILCEQISGSPPPNANPMAPVPTGTQTTREVVTELTSTGACAGCHPVSINPAGFITEGFDSLGRERATEKVFSADGGLIASLPLDTTAVPWVTSSDQRSMSQPSELVEAIEQSQLFDSCLALRYFRFTYERNETPADGCVLSDLEKAARGGATLSDLYSRLVESTGFTTKRFQ